jgi:hypothetical protein
MKRAIARIIAALVIIISLNSIGCLTGGYDVIFVVVALSGVIGAIRWIGASL